MSKLISKNSSVRRVERFHTLQSGQYWRALENIDIECIKKDEVLLIQSIRWVDNAPHTIILRPHPTKIGKTVQTEYTDKDEIKIKKTFICREHRFLIKDFLSLFEFETDPQKVRDEEMRRAQEQIDKEQRQLLETQKNPYELKKMIMTEIRESGKEEDFSRGNGCDLVALADGSLADTFKDGITPESIDRFKNSADREHQIATIKANWIKGKTDKIASLIKDLIPFYDEQAAAALAQTEDVRSYVVKIKEGIESLDLYVGKDVEVDTIRNGKPAPREIPLTFVQKKLMMDEELAIFVDIDEWFDFSQEEKFFEALRAHDQLVEQIFPTERCILVMAATRRYVDYGDSWTNAARNAENRKVFLLVRNGENIYRIFSPIESHLGTHRLFPSKDDQNQIFRGYDGSYINFENVEYTDRLRTHEDFALHYKRFLLLVCGLDHRMKLFGEFYNEPPSLDFVSLEFQQKYCRFLHDDDGEGMLPKEDRLSLREWLKEKNSYLCSGSRVLCNWISLMNPYTAPGVCKERIASYRGNCTCDFLYNPVNEMNVAIAYRRGSTIFVDASVNGYTRKEGRERTFETRVNLTEASSQCFDDLTFLCLDMVRPEELHYYIHNRESRIKHLFYIRFFKRALKFIQNELDEEKNTRKKLADALSEGCIAVGKEADEIIWKTVIAWRAAHRGKKLPTFAGNTASDSWKSLLDQMYLLSKDRNLQATGVETFVRQELGYEPLRLILSGKATMAVYAAPCKEERDDRLENHPWVHKITLNRGKTKYGEVYRRWVILPEAVASETILYEWPGNKEWTGITSAFPSFEEKQRVFQQCSEFQDRMSPFLNDHMPADLFRQHVENWKRFRNRLSQHSRYVVNPIMAIPFGLVSYKRKAKAAYLCMGSNVPHALLYRLAPSDVERQEIREFFVSMYAKKDVGIDHFSRDIELQNYWFIKNMPINDEFSEYGVFCSSGWFDRIDLGDLDAFSWFDRWRNDLSEKARVWIVDEAQDIFVKMMSRH